MGHVEQEPPLCHRIANRASAISATYFDVSMGLLSFTTILQAFSGARACYDMVAYYNELAPPAHRQRCRELLLTCYEFNDDCVALLKLHEHEINGSNLRPQCFQFERHVLNHCLAGPSYLTRHFGMLLPLRRRDCGEDEKVAQLVALEQKPRRRKLLIYGHGKRHHRCLPIKQQVICESITSYSVCSNDSRLLASTPAARIRLLS